MYDEVALVLGLHVNGLGTIRSLAVDKNIPIIGLGKKSEGGCVSRYLESVFPVDDTFNVEQVTDALLKINSRYDKVIPFPTGSDYWVKVLSESKSALTNFVIRYPENVEDLMSKEFQYTHAVKNSIPCPRHIFLREKGDIEKIINTIEPPYLVKPLQRNTGKEAFRTKVCQTRAEFADIFGSMDLSTNSFVVSEIIPGPDSNLYTFGSYASEGDVVDSFCGRKLTQVPSGFGVVGTAEIVPDTRSLGKLSRKMIKSTGFTGISQVEWKLDPRDNELKLMEMNPRSWMWVYLGTVSGKNLPLCQYYAETKREYPFRNTEVKIGKTFINGHSILFNSLLEGKFTGMRILLSAVLKGKAVFAILSLIDPAPFFRVVFSSFKNYCRYFARKLSRKGKGA